MSTQPQPERIRDIYEAASQLHDPAARRRLIERLAEDDLDIQARVWAMFDDPCVSESVTHATDVDSWRVEAGATRVGGDTDDPQGTIAPDSQSLVDEPVVDGCRVLKLIAEGGMGAVYLAEQLTPVRRIVALKVTKPGQSSEDVVRRFESERQALAMMDHAHIARVFDGGSTSSGQPYFIMEYVDGQPLTEYCFTRNATLAERMQLFVDLCMGVQHAHQRGVIHRDLKPSNVLVADEQRPLAGDHISSNSHDGTSASQLGASAVVKIIDFGVAKALETEGTLLATRTQTMHVIGTPLYMAPEQAQADRSNVDTRTDVYALGVILYELITGTTPFDHATFVKLGLDGFRRLLSERIPDRPSTRIQSLQQSGASPVTRCAAAALNVHSLRRELDWIVVKALAREPEQRYQSARELAEDIGRYMRGEPVHACPPSFRYRLSKLALRYRMAIAGCAVVFALLVLAVGWSRWQVAETRRAREESEARERAANAYLRAMKLQRGLLSFTTRDLAGLRHDTAAENWAPTKSCSLSRLLSAAGRVLPGDEISTGAPIHDVAAALNGRRIVLVDERGDVHLWSLNGGKASKLGSHQVPAHAVAVSPDGRFAVTGDSNGVLIYWDLQAREQLTKVKPFDHGVETLSWSPDGRFVAGGARYEGVWLGDSSGRERFLIPNDHRHESLLFTPDGRELIVPTRSDIAIFDTETGRKSRTIRSAPLTNVRAMTLAGANRQWLVAGERYATKLAVFHLATGDLLGQISLGSSYPRSLCAAERGAWIRASFTNGRIQFISLAPENGGRGVRGRIRCQIAAHAARADSRLPLASLDGRVFLSAGADGRICRWDDGRIAPVQIRRPPESTVAYYLSSETGEVVYVPRKACSRYAVGVDPEFAETIEHGLYAAATDDHLLIFQAKNHRQLAAIPIADGRPSYLGLSKDARRLFVSRTSGVTIYESEDGWKTHSLLRHFHVEHYEAPVFCDHGRKIIVGDGGRSEFIELDVERGEVCRQWAVDNVGTCCLDSREEQLAYCDRDRVKVLDLATGKTQLATDNIGNVAALRFMADDATLILAQRDGRVLVWDMATKQSLGALYEPEGANGTLLRMKLADDRQRVLLELSNDNGWRTLVVLP